MNMIDNTIKNIIGNKKRGGKNDLDFDGVPNRKDCQPRNTMRQDDYPFDQPLKPTGMSGDKSVWMGNTLFDSKEKAEKYRKEEGLLRGRIVATKRYGEHILIQDKKGKKYDTKNISPIGCRGILDGELIHGKNKKPDLILNYEL